MLSTAEMMLETKKTGKVAIVVEVPPILEKYKQNWLGSGMFYDDKQDRYCVNKWIKNFGYPSLKPDELLNDIYRKDIKWMIDENVKRVFPM